MPKIILQTKTPQKISCCLIQQRHFTGSLSKVQTSACKSPPPPHQNRSSALPPSPSLLNGGCLLCFCQASSLPQVESYHKCFCQLVYSAWLRCALEGALFLAGDGGFPLDQMAGAGWSPVCRILLEWSKTYLGVQWDSELLSQGVAGHVPVVCPLCGVFLILVMPDVYDTRAIPGTSVKHCETVHLILSIILWGMHHRGTAAQSYGTCSGLRTCSAAGLWFKHRRSFARAWRLIPRHSVQIYSPRSFLSNLSPNNDTETDETMKALKSLLSTTAFH